MLPHNLFDPFMGKIQVTSPERATWGLATHFRMGYDEATYESGNMSHSFRQHIEDPERFVITLELVPGAETRGRTLDTVKAIAAEALEDGRVSAVTITDNPGGNPSLSPDGIGKEILESGMDVVVHFTCRDMNRAGMESRALQLARMGMKNILALTGDYSGTGFGGQGAPVFDLDSVTLLCMLTVLSERIRDEGDPEGFFTGCAVSPFKKVEGECFAQYYKLCKKASAGARFAITQLGYDVRKFQELIQVCQQLGVQIPVLGSVYILTPKTAAMMNSGKVPGAMVTGRLLQMVQKEWESPERGRDLAIERAARLAVVLKGLGYRGVHIGGILRSFETVARILDRIAQIEHRWKDFLTDFRVPEEEGFYLFKALSAPGLSSDAMNELAAEASTGEQFRFNLMKAAHHAFFRHDGPISPWLVKIAQWLDKRPLGPVAMGLTEDPLKKLLLSCLKCGDCGIQHLAFLCPESQCPKHIRNGACGGGRHGRCEVYPDRPCVWVRAYNRLASARQRAELARGCVPPRMWELNRTSSWLNFHLRKDHQSVSCSIARLCGTEFCVLHTRRVNL